MDKILEVVVEAVITVKGIERSRLSADTVIETLKLDSLDEVELMMSLEEKLDTEVDQARISRCRTLGDLAKTLSGQASAS
jgi:acyl carrier protein